MKSSEETNETSGPGVTGGGGHSDVAEYARRLDVVRTLMKAEDIDVVVAADDDGWPLPGGHVRYLSNFHSGSWAPCAVVVPLAEEPVLVVAPGPVNSLAAWARETAWISDIQSSPNSGWPPTHDLAADVVAAIERVGHADGRIGICGGILDVGRLSAALPDANVSPAVLVDGRGVARDLVERARDVKSEWELRRLKEGQRYADVAIGVFFEAVKPGRKLTRAIAEAEWAAKELGADDALTIMAAGSDPWLWWVTQGDRTFSEGDLVSVEINTRVGGYVAQVARSATIGPPTETQRLILDTAEESLHAMVSALAPGVTGGDLWDAGVAVVEAAGLATYGRFGHGIGLSMAECFDVMPSDDGVVRDGQCVELHAGVMHVPSMQSALIGDQFLVEGGRAVPLSDSIAPYDLPVGTRER